MNNIKLTDEELRNLKVFLGRADLKGNEVPAFMTIIQKLSKPEGGEKDAK